MILLYTLTDIKRVGAANANDKTADQICTYHSGALVLLCNGEFSPFCGGLCTKKHRLLHVVYHLHQHINC